MPKSPSNAKAKAAAAAKASSVKKSAKKPPASAMKAKATRRVSFGVTKRCKSIDDHKKAKNEAASQLAFETGNKAMLQQQVADVTKKITALRAKIKRHEAAIKKFEEEEAENTSSDAEESDDESRATKRSKLTQAEIDSIVDLYLRQNKANHD